MILITGGAGFIGSHITDALLEQGHAVRVLDALLPLAHAQHPDYLHPEAEYTLGDLRDSRTVAQALRGIEVVCHQAAMVGLGQDMRDVADFSRHNDLGTAVLLRELALSGFRGRLVLASSMVVYGEGGYSCPEHGNVRPQARRIEDLNRGRFEPRCPACAAELDPVPVDETTPLTPRSVYAATKVHQEHLCESFSRETGIPVTALRYHNVYGPRMPRDTPYSGVAAIFASSVAEGRAPRVFEDGRQLRDFVHVRDVARANVIALTAADPMPGAFNIASGRPRSVGEMAQALADAAGPEAPAPQTTGEFRLGDVRHVFASPARARTDLGFDANEEFQAGMAEFASASLRAA